MDELKQKLKFETFTEFCERADEIFEAFKNATMYPSFSIKEYCNYIYYKHKFSRNTNRDTAVKEKIFEFLMGYKYEYVPKEELFSLLKQLKKGN